MVRLEEVRTSRAALRSRGKILHAKMEREGLLRALVAVGLRQIGFTRRELKRRDVTDLIAGQDTQEICTEGQSRSFQVRSWFLLQGGAITDVEYRQAGYS